jgi:hypothetical protein
MGFVNITAFEPEPFAVNLNLYIVPVINIKQGFVSAADKTDF